MEEAKTDRVAAPVKKTMRKEEEDKEGSQDR
jgi:hypothetical protein